MGKIYEGNVEVFTNKETKKVNIRPNPDGDFNKENVGDLYKFMKQVAEKTAWGRQRLGCLSLDFERAI